MAHSKSSAKPRSFLPPLSRALPFTAPGLLFYIFAPSGWAFPGPNILQPSCFFAALSPPAAQARCTLPWRALGWPLGFPVQFFSPWFRLRTSLKAPCKFFLLAAKKGAVGSFSPLGGWGGSKNQERVALPLTGMDARSRSWGY